MTAASLPIPVYKHVAQVEKLCYNVNKGCPRKALGIQDAQKTWANRGSTLRVYHDAQKTWANRGKEKEKDEIIISLVWRG